jgi:hypothetical protein
LLGIIKRWNHARDGTAALSGLQCGDRRFARFRRSRHPTLLLNDDRSRCLDRFDSGIHHNRLPAKRVTHKSGPLNSPHFTVIAAGNIYGTKHKNGQRLLSYGFRA